MSIGEVGDEGVGGCVVLVLLVGYTLDVGYALGDGGELVGGNGELVYACSALRYKRYLVYDACYCIVDVGYHLVGVCDSLCRCRAIKGIKACCGCGCRLLLRRGDDSSSCGDRCLAGEDA